MPKKKIQRWINDLRSGKFQQTTGTLQDDRGFCCLGVLVKTQSPNHVITSAGFLKTDAPATFDGDPLWIDMIDSDFLGLTGERLTDLNDNTGLSFDEIADCLQAVYIMEVLK